MNEDQRGYLNRDVTQEEGGWLPEDMPKGSVVFRYSGCVGKNISAVGVAVYCASSDNKSLFFELPAEAICWEYDNEAVHSLVKNCSSIDELKIMAYKLGGIRTSRGEVQSPQKFSEMLDKVRAQTISVDFITRNYGLREKVIELVKK